MLIPHKIAYIVLHNNCYFIFIIIYNILHKTKYKVNILIMIEVAGNDLSSFFYVAKYL